MSRPAATNPSLYGLLDARSHSKCTWQWQVESVLGPSHMNRCAAPTNDAMTGTKDRLGKVFYTASHGYDGIHKYRGVEVETTAAY